MELWQHIILLLHKQKFLTISQKLSVSDNILYCFRQSLSNTFLLGWRGRQRLRSKIPRSGAPQYWAALPSQRSALRERQRPQPRAPYGEASGALRVADPNYL